MKEIGHMIVRQKTVCLPPAFSAKKIINRQIIFNFSQNHGDMKEIGLDKIISITLELLEPKTVCLHPAEILP